MMTTMTNHFPLTVTGVMSPYPTVVTVMAMK